MGAKDNLSLTQHGYINIAGLLNAINTGSYNFVNPALNSQVVRDAVAPDRTMRARTSSSDRLT